MLGLSPRLRGNLVSSLWNGQRSRSIPAPAGEPHRQVSVSIHARVYPRACGGTEPAPRATLSGWGLSPRLRGNRTKLIPKITKLGSIPAPAGEPAGRWYERFGEPVYPRACGGTHAVRSCPPITNGLSPRLRGNPLAGISTSIPIRSIPAPAGEPPRLPCRCCQPGVYPRACGGTLRWCSGIPTPSGLSPRLRGNQHRRSSCGGWRRSIPAPAGEPPPMVAYSHRPEVYPRACGGTYAVIEEIRNPYGLSPRLRGNPHRAGRATVVNRSIPAPAGEPCSTCASRYWTKVYPRACGGTWPGPTAYCPARGLSPRLRGNPRRASSSAWYTGSIPAPAGEPWQSGLSALPQTVYPRACGGTLCAGLWPSPVNGLSPRLRGNPPSIAPSASTVRSIPAPAGEPALAGPAQ